VSDVNQVHRHHGLAGDRHGVEEGCGRIPVAAHADDIGIEQRLLRSEVAGQEGIRRQLLPGAVP
jgi:hypothetical protein